MLYIGQWYGAKCGDKVAVTLDPATQAVLDAAIAQGDKPWLYLQGVDADAATPHWLRIAVQCDATKLAPSRMAPPAQSLDARCRDWASPYDADTYYLCVDAFAAHREVITLSCNKTTESCEPVGETIHVNRGFVLHVWTSDDLEAQPTLSGTPGRSSGLYDPTAGNAGGVATRAQALRNRPCRPRR